MRSFDGIDDDDIPDFVGARDHILDLLLVFIRALRQAGAQVPADASLSAAEALAEVGFDDRERVRAAMRATLISREEDLPIFERFFPEFWRRLSDEATLLDELSDTDDSDEESADPMAPLGGAPDGSDEPSSVNDGDDADTNLDPIETTAPTEAPADQTADNDGDATTTAVYSPSGRSEPVSVARAAVADDSDLERPVDVLTDAIAGLRGRRWGSGGDERIDTRRALRRSFSTGGTLISVPRTERQDSGVRATVLVDVSQSVLDTIDRSFLVRFLRRISAEWWNVRIFFFDTDIREVTDEFDAPTSAAALQALDRAETEWGGGTRIGNALTTIKERNPNTVDRETIVFVISDGLEVGELDDLEAGMTWLSRRAEAVLWLNPLAGSPEYAPTCRGMETALPYLDGLFAFTGPDDITEIARQLNRQGLHGTIGFEHDPRRFESTSST
ncbi:MAG: VWA domain-containing protein [Halobacteriales archaeon]